MDGRIAVGIVLDDRDPVAGGRIAAWRGLPGQLARYPGALIAARRGQAVVAALLQDDPPRGHPGGGVSREVALERIAPAIGF